ncbi:MAG: PHP domain-containing protein [Candidatus Gracilibacteria bacterium]
MKKYDLHVHTYHSKCSTAKPAKILKRAAKLGLNGIAITDHNQVGGAIETAKLAREYVERGLLARDFEVIIGEEVMTDQCEVLVYYVREKIKPGRYEDVIREVRKQGAICSVAHPFSGGRRAHIDPEFFRNLPRELLPDAMETFNGRIIFDSANKKAAALARGLGLAETGGSDGHFAFEVGGGQTCFDGDFETNLLQKNTFVFGKLKFQIFKRLLSGLVKMW